MAEPRKDALRHLQADFTQAAEKWPGLHHAFVALSPLEAHRRDSFIFTFLPDLIRCWIPPLLHEQVILHVGILPIPDDDRMPQPLLILTAYLGDSPGDLTGLRRFRELALTAARCVFGAEVDSNPPPCSAVA